MKARLTIALAAALLSSAAFAHSEKENTTPAHGAQLTETPEMIHMMFDDPMRITMVRLLNADGDEMPMERGTGLEPHFASPPAFEKREMFACITM